MITQQRYDELLPRYTEFTAAATAYTSLLAAHELPLSIDVNGLLFAYKTQLFTKLVAVNKGLKMQYDMLKADEAKQALINATVDLTGYGLVTDIATGLQQLQDTLTVANGALRADDGIVKPSLADLVGVDVATYFKPFVIVWDTTNTRHLDTVSNYAATVSAAAAMLAELGLNADSIIELHYAIGRLLAYGVGFATADEKAVYTLIKAADERKRLAEQVTKRRAQYEASPQGQAEAARKAKLLAEVKAKAAADTARNDARSKQYAVWQANEEREANERMTN